MQFSRELFLIFVLSSPPCSVVLLSVTEKLYGRLDG